MRELVPACKRFFEQFLLPDGGFGCYHAMYADESVTNPDAQRRTDFLCFFQAVSRLLNDPVTDNAFDVYFCYAELFHVFGEGYAEVRKVLELLCSHEEQAGKLSARHRDHYVHSALIFAIGLAFYAGKPQLRAAFDAKAHGGFRNNAEEFLFTWGLSALFHDIGYPYELAHNEIREYNKNLIAEFDALSGSPTFPTVTYKNLSDFEKTGFDFYAGEVFYPVGTDKIGLLTDELTAISGLKPQELHDLVCSLPKLGTHCDHGYFGTMLLADLILKGKLTAPIFAAYGNALCAILFHNQLSRQLVDKGLFGTDNKLSADVAPYTYLLLVCDALQNSGRECYGYNQKTTNYPFDCIIDVDNDEGLRLNYLYDNASTADFEYASNGILKDLSYLELTKCFGGALTVTASRGKNSVKYLNMGTFYTDILDFAQYVHESYAKIYNAKPWNCLTLEFKLSNILQTKSYANKLAAIGCIISKTPRPFKLNYIFSVDELQYLARGEHKRWIAEKLSMGWKYGETRDNSKGIHPSLVDFDDLSLAEKNKDSEAFAAMLNNLVNANYKIYRIYGGWREIRTIGFSGHVNCVLGEAEKKAFTEQLQELKASLNTDDELTFICCMADGSDLFCADIAVKLDFQLVAVLPMDFVEYRRGIRNTQLFDRLYTMAKQVITISPRENLFYFDASLFMVENSDEMFFFWDGRELEIVEDDIEYHNMGGTYHTYLLAQDKQLITHVINVKRK